MSTHEQRIEVFQDTMAWIKADKDLSDSVDKAKVATEVFYEDDDPSFNIQKELDRTEITVSGDRSYQAAMRLSKEMPGSKIAVMNFANAFHAGGGVTKGSSAQEECLCRTSTLYPLLYRRTLRDSYYKHHYDLGTPKASDSLIYTEGVVICKTDEDLPKRMPKEDWVTVDVITIAAPDLRTKSNVHAELVGGGTYMNSAELFGYHVKRAIHMLTVAAAKKAEVLVLGAFGCGAFENDPEVVARAFKVALQEFPKMFKRIEFAVYCPPSGSRNYEVFKKCFVEKNMDNKVFFNGVAFNDMSEKNYERPAQILLHSDRFKYLTETYKPNIENKEWVMIHYPEHFLIYNTKYQCCVFDGTYTKLRVDEAVIFNIKISTDVSRHPLIEDDFGTFVDVIESLI